MNKPDFGDPIIEKAWDDALETCSSAGLEGEDLNHMVYTLMARRLVEALQAGHGSEIPAGTFNAALRFCKDNDISGLALPGTAAAALIEKMQERLPFKPKLTTGTD